MARKRRRRLPEEPVEVEIESLTQDGRGVAHVEGKVVFVHGGLPGERLLFRYERIRKDFDEGALHQLLRASPDRVEPRCPHFGVCGGCSLQHLREEVQIRHKEQALNDALERIGRVRPQRLLPPLVAGHWGYRRRARLGVKYVPRKGKVLVGFHERGSSFVTDLTGCEVLHEKIGRRITALSGLIETLSIRDRIPQVEVAMGDGPCALLFRVLEPPSDADRERMQAFADRHGFVVYLQSGGPDTVSPLQGPVPDLSYTLPQPGLRLGFGPLDFTQVNLELNRAMVERALALLDPQPEERLLDLFCGIGNFTLPLATRAGWVTGVEGDAALVARARANAVANALHNADFCTANLYQPLDREPWLRERFDKVLLDPPRTGALEVLAHLPRLGAGRILYISCYPATLARDAGVLVNELGYRLVSAGVMDMFPHTAHVESIALFEQE